MANRGLGENTLNLLTTEYGPYTAFGGVPRPLMNGADVAGAERQGCDEDVLFRAVCARLARLVEHGAAAPTQAGVLECVAALGQLHEHVIEERERHRRCEQALVTARSALAVGRVETAIHLATTHRYPLPRLAVGCECDRVAGHAGAADEPRLT